MAFSAAPPPSALLAKERRLGVFQALTGSLPADIFTVLHQYDSVSAADIVLFFEQTPEQFREALKAHFSVDMGLMHDPKSILENKAADEEKLAETKVFIEAQRALFFNERTSLPDHSECKNSILRQAHGLMAGDFFRSFVYLLYAFPMLANTTGLVFKKSMRELTCAEAKKETYKGLPVRDSSFLLEGIFYKKLNFVLVLLLSGFMKQQTLQISRIRNNSNGASYAHEGSALWFAITQHIAGVPGMFPLISLLVANGISPLHSEPHGIPSLFNSRDSLVPRTFLFHTAQSASEAQDKGEAAGDWLEVFRLLLESSDRALLMEKVRNNKIKKEELGIILRVLKNIKHPTSKEVEWIAALRSPMVADEAELSRSRRIAP